MTGPTRPDLELRTERLVLRGWRQADREPFAALNADPVVMEHFPAPVSRAESDRMVDRIEATFAEQGLRLWAVEVVDGGSFIGFVGLSAPGFEAAFTPCVEVGRDSRARRGARATPPRPPGPASALKRSWPISPRSLRPGRP